jgi:hypothetical protein
MIEHGGETRWCTGDKSTQQSAIQEDATATTAAIPTKDGRRRRGAGQGNNEVEEDYNRGARNCCLDAANAKAKEAAQRELKKDTFNALQLPGQVKASTSIRVGLNSFPPQGSPGGFLWDDLTLRHCHTPQPRPTFQLRDFWGILSAFLGQKSFFSPEMC